MRSFRPRSKAWPQPLAEDRLAARAERAMTSSDDSIYERHLGRNAANHAALTPLGFLARTAGVFPNRVSAIHGARRYTWAETYDRCRLLGSALAGRGIGLGDPVPLIAPHVPDPLEATFGVPIV